MSIAIVPMRACHLAAVAALEAQCFAEPWSENALREELNNPCARFLVAVDADTVVGYLGCHHIAGEGFIANVAVSPAFRRRGIARALVSAALSDGVSLSRISLEVRVSNASAIALYRSLGFVCEGLRPSFYRYPTEDAAIYSYFPQNEVSDSEHFSH